MDKQRVPRAAPCCAHISSLAYVPASPIDAAAAGHPILSADASIAASGVLRSAAGGVDLASGAGTLVADVATGALGVEAAGTVTVTSGTSAGVDITAGTALGLTARSSAREREGGEGRVVPRRGWL